MDVSISSITAGHANDRRIIWDLMQGGLLTVGGWQPCQFSFFPVVYQGAQIGGAKNGYGHFHKEMGELYILLNGRGVMSFVDTGNGEIRHHPFDIKFSDNPLTFEIPAGIGHRLLATTDTTLLIASTGEQKPGDMFECVLPNYTP